MYTTFPERVQTWKTKKGEAATTILKSMKPSPCVASEFEIYGEYYTFKWNYTVETTVSTPRTAQNLGIYL